EGTSRLKRAAQTSCQLVCKPLDATILDGVLEARMRPVFAIAIISLNAHRVLRDSHDIFRATKTRHITQARESRRDFVCHSHAAADENVEAFEASFVHDGHEAEIVREHIHIILRWNGKRDLELARQVCSAVERLFLCVAGTRRLLQEDLSI